jgi:hypothetical protein
MITALLPKVIDDRDALEVLREELDFLEKGGYGRSVRSPWLPTSMFQDSPTCFCYPHHDHEETCVLMRFVPVERRREGVPCHYIPLNEAGDSIETLERSGGFFDLNLKVLYWLRERIAELEREREEKDALAFEVV